MKKGKHRIYNYPTRKRIRRQFFICLGVIVALYVGLLFYCIVADAADVDGGELYLMPEAGFSMYMEEIEPAEIIIPTYEITDEEADLLVRFGTLEGGCDGVEGIANAIQVVFNRVESDRFPDTVEEVIFQTNPVQFPTASKLANANVTAEAYVALDAVIFGEYQENDTHFFESCEGKVFSSWADYSFTYGGHDFYKLKEE